MNSNLHIPTDMQTTLQTSATTIDELWSCFEILKAQIDLMATEHNVSKALMLSMLHDFATRELLSETYVPE